MPRSAVDSHAIHIVLHLIIFVVISFCFASYKLLTATEDLRMLIQKMNKVI